MYQKTYASIGAKLTPNDLFGYYPRAYIFRNNKGELAAASVYWQSDFGKKLGLTFGDNPEFMKTVVIPAMKDILTNKSKQTYAEMSNKIEHILVKKYGVIPIRNKNIIHRVLRVPKSNIRNNGTYSRYIKGKNGVHEKRLYGHPKISSRLVSKL